MANELEARSWELAAAFMSYAVKEIFYTLQGEGAQTGRAGSLLPFRWMQPLVGARTGPCISDLQVLRHRFCRHQGAWRRKLLPPPGHWRWPSSENGRQTLRRAGDLWSAPAANLFCSSTSDLIDALHARKFEIAVETNGTIEAPAGLDWICVSPKAGAQFKQRSGDELKLIFPQPGAEPEQFEKLPFRNFFLQPMDGPSRELNTKLALEYCLDHPRWRLSLQTQKLLGIP